MAVMRMSYMSYTLKRYVDVEVIIPAEDTKTLKPLPEELGPYKCLYLLHGFGGDALSWLYGSRIFKIARDLKIAVVMPAGENHFYVDNPEVDMNYGRFIGEELVDATRKMFPLSDKREDTLIGGLSMGGYGCLLIGSKYPDTFGGIISLSAPLMLDNQLRSEIGVTQGCFDLHFGKEEEFHRSMNNALYTSSLAVKQGRMPKLYVAIGTEDWLFNSCYKGVEELRKMGVDLTFETGEGAHEWTFWDPYIEKGLLWYLKK